MQVLLYDDVPAKNSRLQKVWTNIILQVNCKQELGSFPLVDNESKVQLSLGPPPLAVSYCIHLILVHCWNQ